MASYHIYSAELFGFQSYSRCQQFHGTVDAQKAAVDHEIHVLSGTPFLVGVVLIVGAAVLIRAADDLLDEFRVFQVMAFPDEVDLILHIGIDECADAVWLIPENVIGAPANDDTGFLGGNLTDDILFIFEQPGH